MIHAREDYQHIQDNTGKIPEDEPVFLLRAKDKIAPLMVRYWARLLEAQLGDQRMVEMAMSHADRMEDWQKEHGSHLPDLPIKNE